MCMESKKCDECLDEMRAKSTQIHHEIDAKAEFLFAKIETKHDALMDKIEKRHNYLTVISLFLFGIFGTVIGVTWLNNQQKANASEVLTLKEAKVLRELGDAYYRTIFVQKQNPPVDTTNYNWVMKGIFSGSLRSGKLTFNE